jgi:hypothetical protein
MIRIIAMLGFAYLLGKSAPRDSRRWTVWAAYAATWLFWLFCFWEWR